MSMLDSFFKQRFNAAKCKTLLKLTIPRIKLLRNRREIQIKQMRKDIAKLLETGQEATARIRVEHIIREEKMMAAQEIVELFCELIAVRLPIIEQQRECPLDLKEAISSLCFAAPRCADLQELIQVQILFACKYGKEFVLGATELLPDCGVNRKLIELLSIRAPAPDVKLNLLKEIAEEHELDWDPSGTENELLKPHEDLLNGSTQFVTGSKLPLPEEKPQETTYTNTTSHENTDSDAAVDSDILSDFPEVPKQVLQPNNRGAHVSTPVMLHFPASSLSESDDPEEPHPSGSIDDVGPDKIAQDKQFLPFIIPPPIISETHTSPPSQIISETKDEDITYNKLDLQDVLAAAQAAADSAERAATAARSAASLAQLRISELLVKKKDRHTLEPSTENQFSIQKPALDEAVVEEKAELEKQQSTVSSDGGVYDHHQPQRLPSMDDESFFSYPNLFTTQGSNLGTHDEQAFTNPK